jgi:hypothetical protein
MKTKEEKKKYHDKHASKKLKELQPGAKVRLEPWTYSKNGNSDGSDSSPYAKIIYRRNRQHLRVCPALGSDSDDQTIAPAVDKEMSSPENTDPLSVGADQSTASLT